MAELNYCENSQLLSSKKIGMKISDTKKEKDNRNRVEGLDTFFLMTCCRKVTREYWVTKPFDQIPELRLTLF